MHPIASQEVTSTCSRLSITRKILLPKMFSKESVPPKNSVMKSNSHPTVSSSSELVAPKMAS